MKPHDTHQPQGDSRASRFTARNLRGILLPATTPFDADGLVDSRALGRNIERWNRTGIGGYVILGSTGERVHLDEREVLEVIRTARASVPKASAFVVGVGQQGTRASVAEALRAGAEGADAVLVITPAFYRAAMTPAALAAHYETIADASTVPVVLYNIPQNTGVALSPETVARLASHENIIGIKDSSGDMVNFLEMLRLQSEDFAVLTGHASLLYAALSAGAQGAILAAACVAPEVAVRIAQLVEQGEHEHARELQRRFTPLARAVTTRFGIGGLKHALDLGGYAGGEVRAPLAQPDEAARREIAGVLEECRLTDETERETKQQAEGAAT
ncbi:MAG TPA: dihydrodipicolinate synthase family protein [Pyrinomonadaceae bacterium]|nr:dihydrodipicolinate synthase family protein [Pyrinomonadaceae bacterium]